MSMIRQAKITDVKRITEIYNQCILLPFCTSHTELQTVQQRMDWFLSHDPEHYPVFVFERERTICGYAYLSPYRTGRQALQSSVEVSYYLLPDHFRAGIGSRLISHCIAFCRSKSYKNIIAVVLDKNAASIELLLKYNFTQWGHLPMIAEFSTGHCGHIYFGRKL